MEPAEWWVTPIHWSRLLYYARLGALVQAHLSARAVSLAAGCCSGRLNGIVTVPSLEALVSCHGGRFRENLLFTHRGLSGPAILQISSYWTPGEPINIDLLPERSGEAILFANRRRRALLATVLSETLPRRFAQQWCEAMGRAHEGPA